MFDDDDQVKKPKGHEVGMLLDSMSIDELKRLGRDLERQVLARAVRWQVEDRILLDGSKTVVFA